jgi:hypothetical protein
MRPLFAIVALAGLSSLSSVPLHAQRHSGPATVFFEFDGQDRPSTMNPAEVGDVLAVRAAQKAWRDSVDVLLDQAMMAAGSEWKRASATEHPRYRASILALPVLRNQQPTGLTVYSLTIFEPGFTGWKYVTTYTGYGVGAQPVTARIVRETIEAIHLHQPNAA